MVFIHRYKMFDYKIEEDLIHYTQKLGFLKSLLYNTLEIGILICEISSWEKKIKLLSTIYNDSLIDSFSIQIKIEKNSFRIFLIIKIYGISSNELKYRYKKCKEKLIGTLQNKLKLLSNSSLESVFLSILVENHANLKKSLEKRKIVRSKNGFFLQEDEKKNYFYLIKLNIMQFLQNSEKIETLVGILYTANIQGSLIFYTEKSGSFSLNSCYFLSKTRYVHELEEVFKKNLKSWNFKTGNIFHPFYLGKILLRNPLHKENLCKFKSPPIFLTKLNLIKTNFNKRRIENKIETSFINQCDIDITCKQEKLDGVSKKKEIERIIEEFDSNYIKESNEKYLLSDNSSYLFYIQKISDRILRSIVETLSTDPRFCIIFFDDLMKFKMFNFELKISKYSLKKINIVCGLKNLRKILAKKKKAVFNKQIIHVFDNKTKDLEDSEINCHF
ncbi:MAG: hypothetical protein ACTSWY_00385 [Promethearchaeota archaeon]